MANTSATRATPLRSSTRTPDIHRARTAFDVGAPVAYGPDRPCPEPCVAQRGAPAEGEGAFGSAGDADPTGDKSFFQVDPQLQAEARDISASEQSYTRLDPAGEGQAWMVNNARNADRRTREEVLREYEEHTEGLPPEPFVGPACYEGVGNPAWASQGRRRRPHRYLRRRFRYASLGSGRASAPPPKANRRRIPCQHRCARPPCSGRSIPRTRTWRRPPSCRLPWAVSTPPSRPWPRRKTSALAVGLRRR